jgi:hypothetical protein
MIHLRAGRKVRLGRVGGATADPWLSGQVLKKPSNNVLRPRRGRFSGLSQFLRVVPPNSELRTLSVGDNAVPMRDIVLVPVTCAVIDHLGADLGQFG